METDAFYDMEPSDLTNGELSVTDTPETESQTRYARTNRRMESALSRMAMYPPDPTAVTSFYSDVASIVWIHARKRSLPTDDAADLVQDVCLRMHKRISKGGEISYPYAFVSKVARNMIKSHLQRTGRYESESIEEMAEEHGDHTRSMGRVVAIVSTDADVVERDAIDSMTLETLERLLEPDDYKIIYMRQIEDMSFKQIAEKSGIAPSVARVRHHRAKNRAAECLADHGLEAA